MINMEGTVTLYMEDWELVIEILENTTENVSSLMEKEIRKIIDEIKDVFEKNSELFDSLDINPNDGLASLYKKIEGNSKEEEIKNERKGGFGSTSEEK